MSYYFNKLDKQIQKKIHQMKWENLRPIQEESIDKKNPQFNRNLRNLFLHAVSIKNMIDKT